MSVAALGEGGVSSYSFGMKIVPHRKLPDYARMIMSEEMPKKLKWRLLASVLTSHKKWRFAAWQLARHHTLRPVQHLLLNEIYP